LPADLPDTAPDQCDVADGLTSAAMLQTAAYRHSHLRLCLRLTARDAGETRVPAGKAWPATAARLRERDAARLNIGPRQAARS